MATKYFYIDRSGELVIDAANYESAGSFSEGLAPVLDPRKGWGFIDKTGVLVIPPQFESAFGFSEGLAAVLLDERWGFIDTKGALVIANQFEWVAGFSEGVAVVQQLLTSQKSKPPSATRSEFRLINKIGQTLAVLDHTMLQVNLDYPTFSEGLLCAYNPEKDATGYIDKTGEFVIQPAFAAAGPFSEGFGRVAVLEGEGEKLAFINKNGEFVIPPGFNTDHDFSRNSSGFSEGLAAVSEGLNPSQTNEATFVYIDKTGKIVLETDFFYAGKFRDGLAVVYDEKTNQWGFIDKTGKVVIPVKYELANDFSDGLALVATGSLP